MIQIYITRHDGKATDISSCWEKLTISGSKQSCARMAEVTLPAAESDKYLPELDVGLGYHAAIYEDGKCLMDGFVTYIKNSTDAGLKSVRIYDRGLLMNRNEAAYNFAKTTPEAAVRQICKEFDIQVGSLPDTKGFTLTRKFVGVSLYKILATFYTKAAAHTGVDYSLRFDGEQFCVYELARRAETLVLQPGSNLIQADVTENSESIVNRVLILDKDGNTLQELKDTESQGLYGMGQATVKTSDDAKETAQKELDDGKEPVRQISVTAMGDTRLISGETCIVREPYTGLEDLFAITADTHTWAKNQYTCKLTLDLKNEMVEVDAGEKG